MVLVQVLIILVVLRVIYKYLNIERMKKIENFKPFDDRALPLVGDLFRCLFKPTDVVYQYINDQSANVSDTRLMSILYRFIAVIGNPDDIKTLLSSPYAFEKGTPFCVIGGGRYALLTAFANYWKPLRRKVSSVISISSLKSYFKHFNKSAALLINDLDRFVDKDEFDISQPIGTFVTYSAFRSHLNMNVDDQKSLYEYYLIFEQVLTINGKRLFQFYYQVIIMWFRKKFKIHSLDFKLIRKIIIAWKPHIAKTLESLDTTQTNNSTEEDSNDDQSDFFMKRLVRLFKSGFLIKHSLYENIIFIMAGASSTGSVTISAACLLMAFHPEIADKLYDEIVQYVGVDDEIDYDTLNKMEYLDRVFKETLRLYPAVPLISRKIIADVQIENGIIPAGFDILIALRSLHRNKDIWGPNADQFDPDNFLPDRVAQRPTCAYIPFGYGLRNCLGYKYTSNLNKLILAQLVRKYKFSTRLKQDELKFGFAVTAKLLQGHNVKITRRT